MYSHPIRKLFGLFILYAVIIIGIFVLQFRNDSIFSESIGILRFTIAKTEAASNVSDPNAVMLKNSLQADFRGLSLYFDEDQPAYINLASSNTSKNITLISWTKASPLKSIFTFSDDVSLSFAVSSLEDDADLMIVADFPDSVSSLCLNYKTYRGSNVTKNKPGQLLIADNKNKYTFSASDLQNQTIKFTHNNMIASYFVEKPKEGFSFESTSSMAATSPELTQENIKKLENSIVSLFNQAAQNSSLLTEQSVVSYVAIMARNGQYNTALDSVPDSFKRGQKRTYLSAPYFNTLEQMNSTLQMQINNTSQLVDRALVSNDCDIFTLPWLSSYILQNGDSSIITELMNIPSKVDPTAIKTNQALGIIRLYTDLFEKSLEKALPLQSVLPACSLIVSDSCSIQNDGKKVVIASNGKPFDFVNGVNAGVVLLKYGQLIKNQSIINTGNALINSYFEDFDNTDLFSQAEVYPRLVSNNPYYPHFTKISNSSTPIWAWTCATNIIYSKTDGVATINITFPQGLTHYVIFGGINDFDAIQIYDINFRTDPRFETYNSSGYVHKKNTDTLLLKSRHRNEVETIRIFYESEMPSETGEDKKSESEVTE